jgi:hypothetical protein
MGIPPREMRAMSLWEYGACLDGWRKAHEPEDKQEEDGMTPELFRAIMDAPIAGSMH